jgi:hypothetical protein
MRQNAKAKTFIIFDRPLELKMETAAAAAAAEKMICKGEKKHASHSFKDNVMRYSILIVLKFIKRFGKCNSLF